MINNKFIIIAHRGESYDAPENTLASISLAWYRNDDAVEVDVQLTKDERIVVIHDRTTWRTGRKYKRISSVSYDDLKDIDVGSFKDITYSDERIPLLSEVIDTIPSNKQLFVEIKSDDSIVKPLENLITGKNVIPQSIRFIGFDMNTLKKIKHALPAFDVYWIVPRVDYKNNFRTKETIAKCIEAGFNGLDVQYGAKLNKNVILPVKKHNLKIYTWTVDDIQTAKRLFSEGIDGVATNRAGWMKTELSKMKII